MQSSIRRNFGLTSDNRKISAAEKGIADMMADFYKKINDKLTHQILLRWHKMLTNGRSDLQNIGKFRTHDDPMQIVSGKNYEPKLHFEAPPSPEKIMNQNYILKRLLQK